MIEVGNMNRVAPALARGQLEGAYNRVSPALNRDTVHSINLGKRVGLPGPSPLPEARGRSAAPVETPVKAAPPPAELKRPDMLRPAQRGQKVALGIRQGARTRLRVGFGWNVKDARCDIDASAFLLTPAKQVPSDEWFVFYGQPESPDGAVRFAQDGREDRQVISVDLGRLSTDIERIVFVMTIDEALQRRLNFGMIGEAWLRVLDHSGREIVSYAPTELYENVTSMTLGELYLRNGEWRFNPVGNGVNTDLAGQCAVYGVEISE